MEDIFVPFFVMGSLFIGLPWLILHYVTKWKSAATLPAEDERLLDELYDLARRLEDRLHTVERIISADNPDWRPAIRSPRDAEMRADYRNDNRSN
ncbi:MAG: envelope stress response membrane protein PspB [Sphingopyxis sp.]